MAPAAGLAVGPDAVGVGRAAVAASGRRGIAGVRDADLCRAGAAPALAVAHHLPDDRVAVAGSGATGRAGDAQAAGARTVAGPVVTARQRHLDRTRDGEPRLVARCPADTGPDAPRRGAGEARDPAVAVAADAVDAEVADAFGVRRARYPSHLLVDRRAREAAGARRATRAG